ncbi:MAG: type VI secretion system contractile sheath large subunit [Planctomycetota bacterium]|nr:type VI secretion system contractile sheath large subunit [Planctomycetota bacterium]
MGLLDDVLTGTEAARANAGSRLDRFLAARTPADSLAAWLALEPNAPRPSARDVQRRLLLEIAALDRKLEEQVGAILHHPRFQALEARWRGLKLLVDEVPDEASQLARDLRDPRNREREYPCPQVILRVLDVTWKEIARDMERALEIDQSQIFHKVYSEELGTPGGLPYCALLGDYQIAHRPRPDDRTDDVDVLRGLSEIAAAAFAPLFLGAHPLLFGLESLSELERPFSIEKATNPLTQPEYARWDRFRASDDARFVAVVLPRVLLRRPWVPTAEREDRFRFREDTSRHEQYLWGNAIWAMGTVLLRSYFDNGWLAAIRGIDPDGCGGMVTNLPECWSATDRRGVAPRGTVELQVTDAREKELAAQGFIPLCQVPGSSTAVFYSVPSVQKPARYDTPEAEASSRLSAMMHYILCAARFAHYLKVMGRDAVGTVTTAAAIEAQLNGWLLRYAADADDMPDARRREYPLAEGRAEVTEDPRRPGVFTSRFFLRPQFQIDELATTVRLRTEIVPRGDRRR